MPELAIEKKEPVLAASPEAVGETVQLCDHPGCQEIATHTYIWDWGETGACCPNHQVTLRQKAASLKRGVTFSVINPHARPPMTRDERTRLTALNIVLEEELKEAKLRGGELYNNNKELIGQVQRLSLVERELRAQVQDAKGDQLAAEQLLTERETQLADMSEEVLRLRALVPRPPPSGDSVTEES